jgi:hypothetical protein
MCIYSYKVVLFQNKIINIEVKLGLMPTLIHKANKRLGFYSYPVFYFYYGEG